MEVPLTPHYLWPYGVAVLAMTAFGFLGLKTGLPWGLWAGGGGVGGLVIATIGSGLANAVAVPYTGSIRNRNQLIAFVVVVALLLLVGFLVALYRKRFAPMGG